MLRCLFLVVLSLASTMATAKNFDSWRKHSTGTLISETEALAPGVAGTLGLRITLEGKWHTYWVNPGDSGAAINLTFRNSMGVKIKAIHHPIPERLQTGPLVTFGYSKEVVLPIDVEISEKVRPGSSVDIIADAEWLVCDEVCIPAVDTLKISLPVVALADVKPSADFATLQKFRARLPAVSAVEVKYASRGEDQILDFSGAKIAGELVDFFPFKGSGVTNGVAVVESSSPLILKFKKGTSPRINDERVGLLLFKDAETSAVRAIEFGQSGWSFDQGRESSSSQSLWWMLISAFLGGLILNLMPCVFPILSMKMLSLLKVAQQNANEIRRQNLAYAAGVLVSFLAVALLLSALRSAGHLVGWGFQLQSPAFLSFLIWLFFLLSLNLLGVFEIDFLDSNLGGGLTRLKGLWGSFFTGVLAVVVASPCTAPFMGVALGFGLSQGTLVLIAIFLSLGLGLASPYLLFVVFPAAAGLLPKPGRWMLRLRQFMAFPLLLTSFWLLWILSTVAGVNALFAVLAGCVLLGFGAWLSTWHKHVARVFAAVVVVGTLIFVRPTSDEVSRVSDDHWISFSTTQLEELKDANVFVNMTADWCLTCKVNEALVFSDPEVLALLQSKNVKMVKGDWTKKDENITRFLDRYQRVGVPFYILFSPRRPEGLILPEVLTKSSFIELINGEFPEQ